MARVYKLQTMLVLCSNISIYRCFSFILNVRLLLLSSGSTAVTHQQKWVLKWSLNDSFCSLNLYSCYTHLYRSFWCRFYTHTTFDTLLIRSAYRRVGWYHLQSSLAMIVASPPNNKKAVAPRNHGVYNIIPLKRRWLIVMYLALRMAKAGILCQ